MKENTTIKDIFIGAVIGSIITGTLVKVYSYWNTDTNKTPVRDIEPITYQDATTQTDPKFISKEVIIQTDTRLTSKDATTQENLKPNECKVGIQTDDEQFKPFLFSFINESTEISLIELIGKNDICEE